MLIAKFKPWIVLAIGLLVMTVGFTHYVFLRRDGAIKRYRYLSDHGDSAENIRNQTPHPHPVDISFSPTVDMKWTGIDVESGKLYKIHHNEIVDGVMRQSEVALSISSLYSRFSWFVCDYNVYYPVMKLENLYWDVAETSAKVVVGNARK